MMQRMFPNSICKIISSDVHSEVAENSEDSLSNAAGRNNHVFIRGLRPVIILCRVFGLLSRNDTTDRLEQKRKVNIASIVSACFAFFFLVNAILLVVLNVEKFQKDKTTLVRVEGFHHAVYACSMSFVYCYQFFATLKLRKIVQVFASTAFPQHSGQLCPVSFPKFCLLITCTCLSLGIIENSLFDWQNLSREEDDKLNDSLLERSYNNYFSHWHVIFPHYNFVITLILVILIKLGTYGWIHFDSVCIILCRALWEKLQGMDKNLEEFLLGHHSDGFKLFTDQLIHTEKSKQPAADVIILDNFQDQYVKISQLVEQVEKYICPLILACYAGNIYIIIVMLFNWIGPLSIDSSSKLFVHVCFAFFQYSFRVAIITYFAAEVYQKSLSIRKSVQRCPNSAYSISMERLERTLGENPNGICLLGSFIISRKYFISIISFIFTAEIVLLQTYSSNAAVPTSKI